jgi:pyruvate dehydrogenase phosphatase
VDRSFLASVRPAFELGFGDVAHVGCCAIAAAVLPSAVVVANAGDCRAVLGRVHYPPEGEAEQLPPELEALPAPVFAPLPDDGGVRDSEPAAAAVWRVGAAGGGRAGDAPAPYLFSATALSRDHNAREPREKARLAALHPGEPDIVVCKVGNPSACYVKGRLQPTRSLGDAYLKESEFNVPAGLGRMWGRHIKAPYSPPYVSG